MTDWVLPPRDARVAPRGRAADEPGVAGTETGDSVVDSLQAGQLEPLIPIGTRAAVGDEVIHEEPDLGREVLSVGVEGVNRDRARDTIGEHHLECTASHRVGDDESRHQRDTESLN